MLIDAHSHLDHYRENLHSVIEEIERHRIFTINVAVDVPSYQKNLEIAAMSHLILPTFGIHPWKASEYAGRLDELKDLIKTSPMLGEIGLDYHWVEDAVQYPAQRQVLEFFLAAAREQNKIVNLHTKGAEEEILHLLDRYRIERSIIHWYSGPLDILDKFIERGAYFTVGIEVLYSEHIKNIARRIPTAQLLTEMDNPGGAKWLNGNIGMPAMLIQVVEAIAPLKQTTPNQLTQLVQENFLRLINGDPGLANVYKLFKAEE